MLLVEATHNGKIYKISNEDIDMLKHNWKCHILSFDSISYEMDYDYGGFIRLGMGSFGIVPEFFKDDNPPSIQMYPIHVKNTNSDEDNAVNLFSATGHLKENGREEITYNLYNLKTNKNLLETVTNYDGDVVPLKRGFGIITHIIPVRLQDRSGKPTYHKAYISGVVSTNWHVYDDDETIDGNVTDNGDGTFSLSANPVGEVSLSGVGIDINLDGIFDWACESARLNLTYDNTYVRLPSPTVNYCQEDQILLVDFLSEVSAFFTHFFEIDTFTNTLYLIDMFLDRGTSKKTEFNFFPAIYEHLDPIKFIKSTIIKREAIPAKNYIKESEIVIQENFIRLIEGTATSTGTITLIDSNASFISDQIKDANYNITTEQYEPVMFVRNITDNTEAGIISIDSETEITLDSDIFESGENYKIGYFNEYGEEKEIKAFHDTRENIREAFENILTISHRVVVNISIPLEWEAPKFGEKISAIDESLGNKSLTWFRVRDKTYNFDNNEVEIIGEGVMYPYQGS